MEETYSIPLSTIVKEFELEVIFAPDNMDKVLLTSPEVGRPGLPLAGYYGVFEPWRMQLIGKAEHKYLDSLDPDVRDDKIRSLFLAKPVAVLVTSSLQVYDCMIGSAKDQQIPLLRTPQKTSAIMAALFSSLNVHLAPRITRHGVLVEVYGEGLLILGESGVGKSETAIELVKRGHRLIADDAVEIKRVSSKTLVGSAPEIIRHYVELRGVGIVDVSRLFGMGAVKNTEKIDLVITMEPWIQGKNYDRLGLDSETVNILGIDVPAITIPVQPGRNLAIITEIAAMNNRQKKLGYNTAEEFSKKLMSQMEKENGQSK
ncbi:MAG: HPr(Ser) kinase/phosphatase [Clostridia bacterium]|nr:HPr(Ser) kinase/phosphatase [Clostridia bacterium]